MSKNERSDLERAVQVLADEVAELRYWFRSDYAIVRDTDPILIVRHATDDNPIAHEAVERARAAR